MADDGRRVHIPEPTCLAGKRNEASPASSRQGQEIRVRDRRHSRLFGCSIPTANRIKKSGRIDRAITQIGRKIIVDADMALELAGRKSGGRR